MAAQVHRQRNDPDSAERAARQALAEALAVGDRWAVTWSANIVGGVLAERGDVAGGLEYLDQGLAATEGISALTDARLMLLGNRGELLMWLDRSAEARTALTTARALAERTGKTRRLGTAQSALCELRYVTGQWDEALAEAELPEGADPLSGITARAVAALILLHRHRPAEGQRHLTAARGHAQKLGFPNGPWVQAEAFDREVGGDPAGALAVFTTALATATRLAESEGWLPDIVRLALGQGDRDTAADAVRRAEQFLAAGSTPRRLAAVAHCRGLLEAGAGLLLEAAEAYARADRPLPRAQALEAAAALLAERGEVAAARTPAIGAMDGYAALGAVWDLTQARARFRPFGLRQPTRRLKRPTTGWEALTPAEAKVAELVAQGLSNPEIAEALVIARGTVAFHVAKVLAKLDVRSRIDIARVAAARDTSTPEPF